MVETKIKEVRCFRLNEKGQKEEFHRGIVLEQTTAFARVYDARKESGDAAPETAQWYPIKGKKSWIEGLTT